MKRTRHGIVKFESSDDNDISSVVSRDDSVKPMPQDTSPQDAAPKLSQARQFLTQWNQSASVPPQTVAALRYEELVAEAEALLHKVKGSQPDADNREHRDTTFTSKQQRAAPRTKSAILRVRVSLLSYWLAVQQPVVLYVPDKSTKSQCTTQARTADNSQCHPATGCRQDFRSPSGPGTAYCCLLRQHHQAAAAG